MENDDSTLEAVLGWYSAALLMFLPIPLWLAGIVTSNLLCALSVFILFILVTNFFHLKEGYIGPRNLAVMFRAWLGDRSVELKGGEVPFEIAESTIPGYVAWPGANIPRSIAFVLLIVLSLLPIGILVMVDKIGQLSIILFVLLLAFLLFFNQLKNTIIPTIALSFYHHLSEGGAFFKLLNFYLAILFILLPWILVLGTDNISVLGWLKDVFYLSAFGIFVDFAVIMSLRYGFFGRIAGVAAPVLGLFLWKSPLMFVVLALVEGGLTITGARILEKRSGKGQSAVHLILMLAVIAALYLSSEFLAQLATLLFLMYSLFNTVKIAVTKPDVFIC